MREIKSRGKRKDNGEWVYGYYCKIENKHYIILEGASLGSGFERPVGFVLVIPESVGQYIGRKVKNGKKIYEGDILKDDMDELGLVQFGKLPLDKSGDCVCTYQAFYIKCFGKLGQAPTFECANIGDWMEVIGNIHENKELLA